MSPFISCYFSIWDFSCLCAGSFLPFHPFLPCGLPLTGQRVGINFLHPCIIKPFIYDALHRIFRRLSFRSQIVPDQSHGRDSYIHCHEHSQNPGQYISPQYWDFFNPSRKQGIQIFNPDHSCNSPEKTVEKINPSSQVKWNFAVIPEHLSEYQLRKYAADVFVGSSQHSSNDEQMAICLYKEAP